MRLSAAWSALVCIAACSTHAGPSDGGLEGPTCATLEARAGARDVLRTDMVWVVDNSLGMQRWSGAVRDGLNALAQRFADDGLDPRIVMISRSDTSSAFAGVCVPAPLGSGACPEDSLELCATDHSGPCGSESHFGTVYDELITETSGTRANIFDPDVNVVLEASPRTSSTRPSRCRASSRSPSHPTA